MLCTYAYRALQKSAGTINNAFTASCSHASFTWPDKDIMYTSFLLSGSNHKCHENLALKQYAEQKLALEQLEVWACFPLFLPDIPSSKKAGENGEPVAPLVEQRPGCWDSVVVALEQPLCAPGQAAWLEKKVTHQGHTRLPGSHSKDNVTWLADNRVPAHPRNRVPNPGVHLPSPHSWAAPREVSTWDNHLDLKKPNQPTIQEPRAPAFPQGGFLQKPTILIPPPNLVSNGPGVSCLVKVSCCPSFVLSLSFTFTSHEEDAYCISHKPRRMWVIMCDQLHIISSDVGL